MGTKTTTKPKTGTKKSTTKKKSAAKKNLVIVESPAKAKTIEKYLQAYELLTGEKLK